MKEYYEDLAKKVFDAMNSCDFDQVVENMNEDIVFALPGVKPIEGTRRGILFLKTLLRK